jgi:hypothetical protein
MLCINLFDVAVIFLNGIYVEGVTEKGMKGVVIFHESDHFKERTYYHKSSPTEAEDWIKAI